PCQVSFTLELEFSCSILLDRAEVTLQATSDSTEATPQDNAAKISVPIRYEPNLLLSSQTDLKRYELPPAGASGRGPGPEFGTEVEGRNLGCYPVQNLTLHLALPALAPRGRSALSLSRVLAPNATCVLQPPDEDAGAVPLLPEDLRGAER
ncbi:ITA10 protein, partial [Hirundo rustica]|nr:ITA10 protein [Hirundo rustica]